MEVKMDLAAVIMMMVNSQNDGIEEAIKKTEALLESAEKGLNTSYERLEEAKANDDKRQILIIQDYIRYLDQCSEHYANIRDSYKALLDQNHDIAKVMSDVIKMS